MLTLGCAKYRFNKLPFGTVPGTGIPRLLDIGQCNDSYSAVQIALALAGAFKTDINSLPLYVPVPPSVCAAVPPPCWSEHPWIGCPCAARS